MRIGELAKASGTTTKTLRYYEDAGMLPAPERTAGGYRDYTPDVLPRLDFIRRGRATGLTLAQIREVLDVRDAGRAPCQHVQRLLTTHLTDLDRQITELHGLRDTVAQLRDAAATLQPATCDPATVCRYL
ncbi:hypothetical protein BH24ACT14_BH24ACT14_23120 [soil metagenome]